MPKPTMSLSATPEPSMTFALVPFATDSAQLLTLEPPLTLTPNIRSEQISHRYMSPAPPPEISPFIEASSCFRRVNGGLSCFGKLWNRTNQVIGGAVIRVEVLDDRRQSLVKQDLSVEQTIIPVDSFASYRVLIEPLDDRDIEIIPTIMQQLPTSFSVSTLKIADERGVVMESGRYRLTATIENDLQEVIDNIRVFATIMNLDREIIGYRIFELDDSLQPTERKAVDFEVIPQLYTSYMSHVLHVEGYIKSKSTGERQETENLRP